MRVPIRRIDPSLPLPSYQSAGAVGFDLVCRKDVLVAPREVARLPANVVIAVPEGHVLLVTLRSSTPAKQGLLMPHGVGVIDQDFHGPEDEILVQVFNFSDRPAHVKRGERVAQALLLPVPHCEWDETLSAAGESRGGFGSTD